MKTLELKDIRTGEKLEIKFDLVSDKMEINGEEVFRQIALESDDEQFVFSSNIPGDLKIYHLSKEQITEIKSM